jgi:hypothetical protein
MRTPFHDLGLIAGRPRPVHELPEPTAGAQQEDAKCDARDPEHLCALGGRQVVPRDEQQHLAVPGAERPQG